MKFDLPLPANLGNARMHWAAKNRAKKYYWAALDYMVNLGQLPKPPRTPYRQAHAWIQLRTWRLMDRDNGHARIKWVLDWLQTRGYVMNDKWVTYDLDVIASPRKEVGITMTLECRDAEAA